MVQGRDAKPDLATTRHVVLVYHQRNRDNTHGYAVADVEVAGAAALSVMGNYGALR